MQRFFREYLPLFLFALALSLVIFILLPDAFTKYKLEERFKIFNKGSSIVFDDLDGDGLLECIELIQNKNRLRCRIYHINSNGELTDWVDELGLTKRISYHARLSFIDHNQDGNKECCFFVYDSLNTWMALFDPFSKESYSGLKFVARLKSEDNASNFHVSSFPLYDFNGDGNKDFPFWITATYEYIPRCFFVYDFKNDSLIRYPELGANLSIKCFDDPRYKDKLYYPILNHASGNCRDTSLPFHDNNSWLLVFNKDLQPAFPPVINRGFTSQVLTRLFYANDSIMGVSYFHTLDEYDSLDYLFKFNMQGKFLDTICFKNKEYRRLFVMNAPQGPRILLNTFDTIMVYNSNLEIIKRVCIPGFQTSYLSIQDIDNDAFEELIILNYHTESIEVYTNKLEHPVSTPMSFNDTFHKVSKVKFGYGAELLAVNTDKYLYGLEYSRNKWYFMKYIVFAGIFLSIALLLLLLLRMQRKGMERKALNRKQLLELQLKSLKNQIDPHFTLNALNSIASMSLKGDEEKAYAFITRYSRIIRRLLDFSDSIDCLLKDELDFVKDYVELESMGMKQPIELRIDYDNEDILKLHIPRMLLHTFVENAVKHGLKGLEDRRPILSIEIKKKDFRLWIRIADNGPGFKGNNNQSLYKSTGKGLLIMKRIMMLYRRLGGAAFSYEILKLNDNAGSIIGTEIIIKGDYLQSKNKHSASLK